MTAYEEFLSKKVQIGGHSGFEPLWLPDSLFDFQRFLVEWALLKGKAAVFADCGLGKTLMALVWAENVVRKTNKPVLIMTPLAVAHQFIEEGEKFGIEVEHCRDGKFTKKIVVTNYERLHYFDSNDFVAAVCDESSILKNFDGKMKAAITEFLRRLLYRLLGTATAAPNDYIELGTSSEALGELGYIDMLKTFFKANNDSYAQGGRGGRFNKQPFGGKFRFRGHAESEFWRWVCSWARAIRKPSDLGFDDGDFILPALIEKQHLVKARTANPTMLFDLPAHGLTEQRDERRRTIQERCEKAAACIIYQGGPSVAWCNLNPEGDLLEKLIPDCVQVAGCDSVDEKEEALDAFRRGKIKNLVTKPDIAGWGCNWQHCAHQTFFPWHSFEQWYQSVRRSWRFGQTRPVIVDVITTEGEASVLKNLQRKAEAASRIFSQIVALMNNELSIQKTNDFAVEEEIPVWL